MRRPSFATTIRALQVAPTDEEADVAEVLAHVEAEHRPVGDSTCTTCAAPWPCPVWNEAEQDAVLFLGRAQDRVAARARHTLDRLAEADRNQRTAS